MRLVELRTVRHRLQVGVPLPFNVRHRDETLLLARGQILISHEQLDTLCRRGMQVDLDELQPAGDMVSDAPAEQLPVLWEQSIDRVARLIVDLPRDHLEFALEDVSQPLLALTARDPDLAIFQVMRQHGSRHAQYGVNHSIHCAIAALLTAQRLRWAGDELKRAFKAALTMNLSMLELQGRLATQAGPPTPQQRDEIHTHPTRSAEMLEAAGVRDAEWLQGVVQHHETRDGSGYPTAMRDPCRLAALLQHCDVYTAKLTPRLTRESMAADMVARKLFADNPKDPMVAALVKEFGLYPPGSFVHLASGEIGVVVRRGAAVHTPVVAALTNERRVPRMEPVRRDTADRRHAVVGIVAPGTEAPPLAADKVLALAVA